MSEKPNTELDIARLKPRTFTMSVDEQILLHHQMVEHYQTCMMRPDSFGGLLTYSFTPCGIGDGIRVTCPCGHKFDPTDYDAW